MEILQVNLVGEQKELVIRQGDAQNIFQYNGFRYETTNTESFIAAVRKFGTEENTVIASSDGKVVAIIDCTVTGRPQDRICLKWGLSPVAMRWGAVIGKPMQQPQFVKFLEREARIEYQTTVEQLLAQVKNLKINAQIIGDYSMDDRNNYTFMYKIGDTEGTTKIPSVIDLYMQMIDGGRPEIVTIEIEFVRPSNPQEKPTFTFSCPTWQDIFRKSCEYEFEQIKQGVWPGALVICGTL